MPVDKKISEEDELSSLDGTEDFILAKGGVNKRVRKATIIKTVFSDRVVVVPCGTWDIPGSGNKYPVTGGTADDDSIEGGNEFDITTGGIMGGEFVPAGVTIRAKISLPGQVDANWKKY